MAKHLYWATPSNFTPMLMRDPALALTAAARSRSYAPQQLLLEALCVEARDDLGEGARHRFNPKTKPPVTGGRKNVSIEEG